MSKICQVRVLFGQDSVGSRYVISEFNQFRVLLVQGSVRAEFCYVKVLSGKSSVRSGFC